MANLQLLQQPHRRPKLLLVILSIILACVGVVALIILAYKFGWSGTGFLNKTLWDWMQLLIIPATLAFGAILFNRAERKNEQEIASDNQREAILQDYLNRMSELLLEKDLRKSEQGHEVRTVARVRTLTVLHRLDGLRKGNLLQFLHESKLINGKIDDVVIILQGADLNGANLSRVFLNGANLSRANLNHAVMDRTVLTNAIMDLVDLNEASLKNADLIRADLSNADLSKADLSRAILMSANLNGAILKGAILDGADLRGATISPKQLNEVKSRKNLIQ